MALFDSAKASTYATGTRLFVYALAVAHAAAFASFWVQWEGLIGPSGILPAEQFLQVARDQLGRGAYFEIPTLCWIFGANHFITVLCAAGLGLSILLFLRISPALSLILLWVCSLSLVSVGQIFFDFQWDALLLESTLLAIFIVPWKLGRTSEAYEPPRLALYLIWWLLFRLMFLSGAVKLASGDPSWRNLTALSFHYQTQPLPSPLAWYANRFPLWIQKLTCAILLAVELVAPLLIPAPRKIRHWAALSLITLQILIALTGNYAYFNLLTIGLCLACLDDDWWRHHHWGVSEAVPIPDTTSTGRAHAKTIALRWFAAFAVGVTFFESFAALYSRAASSPIVGFVANTVAPFRSFNDYGLFAVMTVERPELIIEGSDDGKDWREYALPYKPGDLARRPSWVAPHQPRLDWQLWFAALGPPDSSPWVGQVCVQLLKGERSVTALFSRNPFPDHPPHYMRVIRYRYEFTDPVVHKRTGNWWRRTPIDFYIAPVALPAETR
jgi:lipase maturation factor 1